MIRGCTNLGYIYWSNTVCDSEHEGKVGVLCGILFERHGVTHDDLCHDETAGG
jgi:hypothetical protein